MKIVRIFRNTFTEGLNDTFAIFMGNHGLLSRFNGKLSKYQFGLLDLTLLPLIGASLVQFGFPVKLRENSMERVVKDETKSGFFRGVIGAIGLAIEATKTVFAGLLTLMVSPIVLSFHLLKYPFSKGLEVSFYKLSDGDQSLGDYAHQYKMTLNDLQVQGSKNAPQVECSENNLQEECSENPEILTIQVDPSKNWSKIHNTVNYPSFFCQQITTDTKSTDKRALAAGRMLGFDI